MLPSTAQKNLLEYATFVKKDTHAELECKILANKIQTKDIADRITTALASNSRGAPVDEHRALFCYPDGLRVVVSGPENIHKVCTTGSFRGVPLIVERKRKYFDVVTAVSGKSDMIDLPEYNMKFTLRHEEHLRRDFSGSPMDPSSHVRILNRRSWTSLDGTVRYDFAMVKSKTRQTKTFQDILKQTPTYELELEVIDRKPSDTEMVASILNYIKPVLEAYQGSEFLLTASDTERYRLEFEAARIPFINPVSMERRHLRADRPHSILTGYTVTNKADGERCFLVVMRDKRVLRVTPSQVITWTGLMATNDAHVGDTLDGEYLADRNMFCIFDVYAYRGRDTRRLPLMITDEDVTPTSRLGCAHAFVSDLSKDFIAQPCQKPLRVMTKLFLAGDGASMEEAIRTILDTKFEYATDGLVFTPRMSPVAPMNERRGNVWTTVYKWKPASHNTIDFLLKIKAGQSYDVTVGRSVVKGTLYVSRSPGDIIHPCETITGEYVEPQLSPEMRVLSQTRDRLPSPFQPGVPRSPDAHVVMIPVNEHGIPIDQDGNRIDDNTIIECAYDTDTARWTVVRTRHDKTHQYRVLGKPQFGNDINVAEAIWTNIHVPITEPMLRTLSSVPPDDTFEDDLYYRDNLDARDRILQDVYGFHNRIKDDLYRSSIKSGDTLLELGVGRAGDLLKWTRSKPSLLVGIDTSMPNLVSTRQGACIRYIKYKQQHPTEFLPPALFIQGDMTEPLEESENRYAKILMGKEPANTPYLEKFSNLKEFNVISCQFAIHYACESEAKFKAFVKNLVDHGKGIFFGTCMDGASVYALLMGKTSHTFRADTGTGTNAGAGYESQVFGEFVKDYDDGEGWTEEFGQAISVHLESFEKPQREYLVPFAKMTEILAEAGYELVGSSLFSDIYAEHHTVVLTPEHQSFSFLHRSFVFQKAEKPKKKEVEAVEVPVAADDGDADAEVSAKAEKPKKKIIKKPVEKGPEPVLFFGADEGKGEWRMFSNMFESPIQMDSITFPTVEHYFQWSKANKFGDGDIAAKILKTPSAKAVKALGKKVKEFKKDEWDAMKDSTMAAAVKAKIMQHPEIRDKLKTTGVRPIGEASARDKYWGIGTSAETSKAADPSKWPGKNVLGKILMDIRKELAE
jgi:ribA/ribD-fused uncharacterized protein